MHAVRVVHAVTVVLDLTVVYVVTVRSACCESSACDIEYSMPVVHPVRVDIRVCYVL